MRIVPVILCGGGGARLWPSSRPNHPKQFLRLLGELSLFQTTVRRLAGQPGMLDPVIVAGAAHEGRLSEQLGEIGQSATLLLEPSSRDSGPAVAAAALHIAAHHPDAVAVVLASDHHIPSSEAFRAAVHQAVDLAQEGRLVTLGVSPTSPSSAYGYIRPGRPLTPGAPGHAVDRFVEKPDLATAEKYLRQGYLWNSGNFVAPVALLAEEFRLHAPQVLDAVARGLTESVRAGGAHRLSASFAEAPRISFDCAVMEKTTRAAVLPVDFAWSDLGAWDAVWAAGERDEQGNSVEGAAVMLDTSGAVVRAAPGMLVATVGVKDIAVIVEHDTVLVCALDRAQCVKTVIERIADRGSPAPREANGKDHDLLTLSRRLDDWLDVSALPLWWSLGADHQWGGYHDCLSLTGRPVVGPRRARVQMRQVYVYAAAGASGWNGPWLQAMEHGLAFFEGRFRRSDGLFRSAVNDRGAPIDDAAMLYDQAFALLGWATGARVTLRPDFEAKATELLAVIRSERRCPAGGFFESGERTNQSNPHMHMLEAALAWMEAGGGPAWEAFAREIVDLALSRFVDAERGYVREFFDRQWRPAPGEMGRLVEPGHQFEWAWLLGRWSKLVGDPTALETAIALFQNGVSGVDPHRGVAVDALNDDLQVRSSQARLWPQTERLKAALLLAELDPVRGRIYEAHAVAAARSLLLYLGAPVPGVWRDKLFADGSWKDEPAPASSLYHIACAVWELRRTQTETTSRSFRSWGAEPIDVRRERPAARQWPALDGSLGEPGWA